MDEIDGRLQVLAAEAEVLTAEYRIFKRDYIRWILYTTRIKLISILFVVCSCKVYVGIGIGKWFFFPSWVYGIAGVSVILSVFGFVVAWQYPHIRTFDPHREVEEMRQRLLNWRY